ADAEVAALDWVAEAAVRYENLNVLVARLDESRCLVRLRGGRLLEARTERSWGARRSPLDPILLGSAVNLWLTDADRAKDLTDGLTLRTGQWRIDVAFTEQGGPGSRP
ncbi:hypothetical protein DDE05_12840, partial [Streptomyces cavourensis]